MNDNRNYHYGISDKAQRKEYPIISSWIPKGSKVLDLGCGEGSLLALLRLNGVYGEGMDISKSGIVATRKKGIKAIVGRVDEKLPYADNIFDYTICNVTLSMVMYPEELLGEMIRVSKRQIITFPNFGFLLNRIELLLFGRMPHFTLGGYDWYSTGQIHQLTIRDFEEFSRRYKIRITKKAFLYPAPIDRIPQKIKVLLPDSFAMIGLYLLEKI